MPKPLEGVLVISIEQALAAPLCSARLAEAGARVIKVERAEGDFARGYDQAAHGSSSYFTWANQGKESINLNFREKEDGALLRRMISKADVLVQNLAPGAMARAGFASSKLRAQFPKLITMDITGYGESESVKHLKAYDFLIQGESGLTAISGGETQMGRIGVSLCDIGAGMTAHAAILEALIKRGITGAGSALGVSLFDVTADWMTVPLIHAEYGNGPPRRVGLRHPSIAPYGAYETSEGSLTLIAIQNEREFKNFCTEVLMAPQAAEDTRFLSNTARVENLAALDELISSVSLQLTQEAFRTRLAQAGVAYGAVNTLAQLGVHPALRRRSVTTENGAKLDIPAPPIRWLDEPDNEPLNRAPVCGEQNAALREEFRR